MAQYCDSKILEKNWFYWLLSSSTPSLEDFRKCGLLWTKIIDDNSKGKKILPDPRGPIRMHCIALAEPIYFNSNGNSVDKIGSTESGQSIEISSIRNELDLLSDSNLHVLEVPFFQTDVVIPKLISNGYILEFPTNQTWHAMLNDVDKMCHGIATKFNQPNEEEQSELANEALLQVAKKMANYKLVYTPGRAPVFNLLTTTIHRCMYSIMNRRNNQRKGLQKYINELQFGKQGRMDQFGLMPLQTVAEY